MAAAERIVEDKTEIRLARLESDVAHLRSDVAEIKTDQRKMWDDISSLRAELRESIAELRGELRASIATLRHEIARRPLLDRMWTIGVAATLLGAMARGFKWI